MRAINFALTAPAEVFELTTRLDDPCESSCGTRLAFSIALLNEGTTDHLIGLILEQYKVEAA